MRLPQPLPSATRGLLFNQVGVASKSGMPTMRSLIEQERSDLVVTGEEHHRVVIRGQPPLRRENPLVLRCSSQVNLIDLSGKEGIRLPLAVSVGPNEER